MKPPFTLDQIDLRLLRIFAAVVEAGGFAAAQEPLGLSLPSISNHVASLETRLGVTLCRRGRAGFKLTPDGEIAYAEIRRLMSAIEGFQTRVGALATRLGGTLRIGLIDTMLSDRLARLDEVFARFAAEAPNVTPSIVTRPPNELLRDIAGGAIQIAIGSFPRMVLGFDYTDLYAEQHLFYCGSGHPLFGLSDAKIDIDLIRRHRIIARAYWGSRDLRPFAVAAPGAVVADMEAATHLILSGAFLGYLPEHHAVPFVEGGRMRSIKPDELRYDALFQIAHSRDALAEPAVRLFSEIATSLLRR